MCRGLKQTKNVFSVRLKRSVDRSTERKEVGGLFQILDPATAKLRSSSSSSSAAAAAMVKGDMQSYITKFMKSGF